MRMTKELKQTFLRGVEETLNSLCNDVKMVIKYEKEGDQEKADIWERIRKFHRGLIINDISDLIEVYGEENEN